ncbi:hypothetical protein QFC21_005737 [Naganishia friedmannii]|uniref:Uncharacterized protein n=1 Tax=Naganishia friedmannii TaxID=89922 RepID=A0ACC2V6H3_9TREE|nr:hypothetical protein QFC21_005737 [Naganishia friedmannii]
MFPPSDTEAQPERSSSTAVYRFSSPKKPSEYIRSASDMLRYLGPRLSTSPSPPLHDGAAAVERHHAPSLHRRTTDLETNGHHPYRPLQSEIMPVHRYGYSSHNPTHTMANVETSPPQRTTKTRRREAWQIDILEAFYRHKHMPDKQEKEMLAGRINDTLKYVNIWFQNRRQAAQKKGELRPRETYEHWRHRRHAEYELFPTPPEYSTSAASTSYFAQSYPSHEMMLATPREMEEHRMPSVASSMVASPPGSQPAQQSPFAFGLPLPLKGYSGANPLPIPENRSRPVYPSSNSYERPTYTPPYSAEGLLASNHAYNNLPQSYPERPRPDLSRSISMRREAPGPSISGFHLEEGPASLLLPSLPGLGISNLGTMANPSTLIPRTGTGDEYPFTSRTVERSPPSDLKLPPISSLALPDEDTWISAIAARRSQ